MGKVDYRRLLKLHINECLDDEGIAFDIPDELMTDDEKAAWAEIIREIDAEFAAQKVATAYPDD